MQKILIPMIILSSRQNYEGKLQLNYIPKNKSCISIFFVNLDKLHIPLVVLPRICVDYLLKTNNK